MPKAPKNAALGAAAKKIAKPAIKKIKVPNPRVKKPHPDGSAKQVDTTVTPNDGVTMKTGPELRKDAEDIHKAYEKQYGERASQGLTVATIQDKNGNLFYVMNRNTTSKDARDLADSLGYKRLMGPGTSTPDANHAERIALNINDLRTQAVKDGKIGQEPYSSLPEPPMNISPSRKPCDDATTPPANAQNCRAETQKTNGLINLVGWP